MKEFRIILGVIALFILTACTVVQTYEAFESRADAQAERQHYAKALENYSYSWQLIERDGANKPIRFKVSKIHILEKRAEMHEKLGDIQAVDYDRKLAAFIERRSEEYDKDFIRVKEKLQESGLTGCGQYALDDCVDNLLMHGPQTIPVPDGFLFIDMNGNVFWE